MLNIVKVSSFGFRAMNNSFYAKHFDIKCQCFISLVCFTVWINNWSFHLGQNRFTTARFSKFKCQINICWFHFRINGKKETAGRGGTASRSWSRSLAWAPIRGGLSPFSSLGGAINLDFQTEPILSSSSPSLHLLSTCDSSSQIWANPDRQPAHQRDPKPLFHFGEESRQVRRGVAFSKILHDQFVRKRL